MDSLYGTCDLYCESIGRICTYAWEDESNGCERLEKVDCQYDFGSFTHDAICECGEV